VKLTLIYIAAFVIGLACGSCRPVNNSDAEYRHQRDLRLYRLYAPQGMEGYAVGLRRLHLFRPDLIPYPIAYAVYA
jgi:hypothetical protein